MNVENKKFTPEEMKVVVVRQKAEENLCLELSVEENLLIRLPILTLHEKIFPKKYLSEQAIDSLNGHTELKNKMKQVSDKLSGGQKHSLAFFSATAQKLKLLCLDEFLSSTDYLTSQSLRQKTRQYALGNNVCFIIVSHDFDVALEDADNIIILGNGQLIDQFNKYSEKWSKLEIVKLINM